MLIFSSRDIEKACNRDINFIWLLQGQKAPDHNTIANFRSKRLESCIDNLFNQLIIKLGELEEIKYKNIFIDGKISVAYISNLVKELIEIKETIRLFKIEKVYYYMKRK